MSIRQNRLWPLVFSVALTACGAPDVTSTPGPETPSAASPLADDGSWRVSASQGVVSLVSDEPQATLHLRTASVAIGQRSELRLPSLVGAGAPTLPWEHCVEEVVPRATGVEQRWRFDARPPTGGDLVVRVGLDGASFTSADADGLHFSARPGTSLVYSHATWVDADGRRVEVPARWEDSAIVLRVPAEALRDARYPAVLDPVLQQSIVPGPTPASGNPARGGEFPSLAVSPDGTVGLAAWFEVRVVVAPGASLPSNSNNVIVARFNTATGEVLDPAGIPLANYLTFASTTLPDLSVAATPGGFRVAVPTSTALSIYTVPFSGPLTDAPRQIARAGATVTAGGMACTATVCLAAATINSGVMIAARFAAGTGLLLDAEPVTIATARENPSVGTNGTDFLVGWSNSTPTVTRVRSTATVPVDVPPVPLTGVSTTPLAITGDAASWQVAWNSRTTVAQTSSTTQVALLRPDNLQVMGAGPVTLGPAKPSEGPAMARVGTNLGVAWSIGDLNPSLRFARVNAATGALVDASPQTVSTTRFSQVVSAAIVGLADRWIIGGQWTSTSPSSSAPSRQWVRAVPITGAAAPSDAQVMDLGVVAAIQDDPVVAFDGTNALVVWRERRNGSGTGIYAARVRGSDGAVLDVPAVPLSAVGSCPAVTAGGGRWFVAWSDGTNCSGLVQGARLSAADLSVLDATPVRLTPVAYATSQYSVRGLGFDGTSFVAMLTQADGFYQVRVDPADGRVLSPSGTLVAARSAYSGNALPLSCDVTGCVTWGSRSVTSGGQTTLSVYAQGLPGSLHATFSRTIFSTTSTSTVVGADVSVRGRTVTAALGTGTDIFSTTRRMTLSRSTLSPDGTSYALVTGAPASRSSQSSYRISADPDGTTLYGALVDDRLSTFDVGEDLSIAAPGLGVSSASIGLLSSTEWRLNNLGSRRWLITWREFAPASPYGNYRLRAAIVGPSPAPAALGAACTTAAGCVSGFCADGVCCNTACGLGLTNDCVACSVATGASVNGTCATRASGSVCRASVGVCDVAETCNGVLLSCPADGFRTDGSPCDDSLSCNGSETCRGGACQAGTARVCDDGNPCTTDRCVEPGTCTTAPITSCTADGGTADVGTADVGVTDGGTTDAGATDAGTTDVGTTDVGTTDVGTTDAGTTDVVATDVVATDVVATDVVATDVVASDAGTTDAGRRSDVPVTDVTDAGLPSIDDATADASGLGDDAAASDADGTAGDDAGPVTSTPTSGCGCRTGTTSGPSAMWWAIGLLGALSRRRRGRRTVDLTRPISQPSPRPTPGVEPQ